MTFDWEMAITGVLVCLLAFVGWVTVDLVWTWFKDRAMYRRVERHATQRWVERHSSVKDKEKHDGWMG